MNPGENAALSYDPGDDEQFARSYEPGDESDTGGVEPALAEAERQLSGQKGVLGMGMTLTPTGEDAIVVYVQDRADLENLPTVVAGVPVVGEVTGEIEAL